MDGSSVRVMAVHWERDNDCDSSEAVCDSDIDVAIVDYSQHLLKLL